MDRKGYFLPTDTLGFIARYDVFKSWRTLIGQTTAKETSNLEPSCSTKLPSSAADSPFPWPDHDSQLFPLPQCHKILKRDNFVIVYDQAKRIPHYVAETLTKESLEGECYRRR